MGQRHLPGMHAEFPGVTQGPALFGVSGEGGVVLDRHDGLVDHRDAGEPPGQDHFAPGVEHLQSVGTAPTAHVGQKSSAPK